MLVKDVHHTASKGPQRRSPRTTGGRYGSGDGAAEQDLWLNATQQMVIDLCARFGAATGHENPPATGDAEQQSALRPGGMPIRLHKDATIEAEYHMQWPRDATSKLPSVGIAPLELHYVRVSADQHTRLVPAHYRRQVRNMREELDGSITWLDGFERDREKGSELSIDIRIDGIEETGRSAAGGALTVEILTVEIPDVRPRPAPSEPATSEGNTTASAP